MPLYAAHIPGDYHRIIESCKQRLRQEQPTAEDDIKKVKELLTFLTEKIDNSSSQKNVPLWKRNDYVLPKGSILCPFCWRSFDNETIRTHLRCNACSHSRFESPPKTEFVLTWRNLTCKKCKTDFNNFPLFDDHCKEKHENEIRIIFCIVCHLSFPGGQIFYQHHISSIYHTRMHNRRITAMLKSFPFVSYPFNVRCFICKFNIKHEHWVKHLLKQHCYNDFEKLFFCQVCDIAMARNVCLHHTSLDERHCSFPWFPILCILCREEFVGAHNFRNHIDSCSNLESILSPSLENVSSFVSPSFTRFPSATQTPKQSASTSVSSPSSSASTPTSPQSSSSSSSNPPSQLITPSGSMQSPSPSHPQYQGTRTFYSTQSSSESNPPSQLITPSGSVQSPSPSHPQYQGTRTFYSTQSSSASNPPSQLITPSRSVKSPSPSHPQYQGTQTLDSTQSSASNPSSQRTTPSGSVQSPSPSHPQYQGTRAFDSTQSSASNPPSQRTTPSGSVQSPSPSHPQYQGTRTFDSTQSSTSNPQIQRTTSTASSPNFSASASSSWQSSSASAFVRAAQRQATSRTAPVPEKKKEKDCVII